MRLISLTLRHYRIHHERTVTFDPGRTVIGGPNESGKSTLAEAAHHALFLQHRRGGKDQKAMKSRLGSEPPEVELVFEQDGVRHTLRKCFKGSTGTIELRDDAHGQWSGDEAEERLARLLGYDGPVGASRVASRWAHLWIRQGESGGDPSDPVSAEQDKLLPLLQQQGGAALMQSELDQRVANEFQRRVEEWFTKNDSPKAGSPLRRAEEALEQAREQHEQRRAAAEQLARAIEEHEAARRDEAEADAWIPRLERQLAEESARLREAEQTATLKKEVDAQLVDARRHAGNRREIDARIRELQRSIESAEPELEPLRKKLTTLREERGSLDRHAADLRREHEAATAKVRNHRLHQERLEVAARLADNEQERTRVRKRLAEVTQLRSELVAPREQLAGLPALDERTLESLRALELRRERAATAIDAIATGVEWLDGAGPLSLDGRSIEPGTEHTLTSPGVLEVAGHRIRIRPGGGDRLEEARREHERAGSELDEALQRCAARTLDDAVRTLETRRELAARIEQLTIRLETHHPDQLARDEEQLATRAAELSARLERCRDALADDSAAPATLAEAEQALEDALRQERANHEAVEGQREKRASFDRELEATTESLRGRESELGQARVQRDTLVETHGDDAARRQAIAEAERRVEELEDRGRELARKLGESTPEQLQADVERSRRSLEQQKSQRQQANQRRIRAATILESDGSSDPHAALAEAAEVIRRAEHERKLEHRRAEAVRRLAGHFRDEQRQLSNQLTEPLIARIDDYLRCIFGPEVTARMELRDGSFQGLELLRDGNGFSFDELSGGTREQLAAAVRLAATELLAARHDGCLPVVFDDAFTHSDPERTAALQRMLDLAARRGLQVIVLSCNPADYTALGAQLVRLERP